MVARVILLVFLLFFTVGCLTTPAVPVIVNGTAIPSPTAPVAATAVPIRDTPAYIPTALPTPTVIEPTAIVSYPSGETRRLWPVEASSDFMYFDMEMVTGAPDAQLCDNPYAEWLSGQHEEDHAEHYVQFTYEYALLPEQINLTFSAKPADDFRVEVMDSSSGLSRVVYEGNLHTDDTCPAAFYIPVETDIAADTVIVTFEGLHSTLALSAVELIGVLPGTIDLPVFWRIEIPADSLAEPDSQFPGGLAVDAMNTVFVANGRNGIQRYDVEGNLMKNFSVPLESNVRDVSVRPDGSIVVTDAAYQWFITLGRDGLQVNAGGEDFSWNMPQEVAVHPENTNIYLLDAMDESARIRIYNGTTARWIRDLPLEANGGNTHWGLVFDVEGYLYAIDHNQTAILKMDPESGAVLDTLGYSALRGMSPIDLAVDAAGNLYVLLGSNPDGSAVVVLDAQGNLLRRFGSLTYDGSGWGEGTFLFPVSIAVTADGRFVFVCENGFLTAYLFEL